MAVVHDPPDGVVAVQSGEAGVDAFHVVVAGVVGVHNPPPIAFNVNAPSVTDSVASIPLPAMPAAANVTPSNATVTVALISSRAVDADVRLCSVWLACPVIRSAPVDDNVSAPSVVVSVPVIARSALDDAVSALSVCVTLPAILSVAVDDAVTCPSVADNVPVMPDTPLPDAASVTSASVAVSVPSIAGRPAASKYQSDQTTLFRLLNAPRLTSALGLAPLPLPLPVHDDRKGKLPSPAISLAFRYTDPKQLQRLLSWGTRQAAMCYR